MGKEKTVEGAFYGIKVQLRTGFRQEDDAPSLSEDDMMASLHSLQRFGRESAIPSHYKLVFVWYIRWDS